MQISGTVLSVEMNTQVAKNGGGFYPGARFSYRDQTGALKEQGFHEKALKFNPTIKNQLEQLEVGKGFTMVKEKEGEFWQVRGIYLEGAVPSQAPSAGTTKAPLTPNASPKSNYETPEERAQRQVYIIRQSAVNYAVNAGSLLKLKNKEEILSLAKFFESYVFGVAFDDGSIYTMPNDDIDVD